MTNDLTLDAGGGNDTITASGVVTVVAGAGDDTITYTGDSSGGIISGGGGVDSFKFIPRTATRAASSQDYGDTTITDFEGAVGETIDIDRNSETILTISDSLGGAVVAISGNTDATPFPSKGTITLAGISAANVDDGWFI